MRLQVLQFLTQSHRSSKLVRNNPPMLAGEAPPVFLDTDYLKQIYQKLPISRQVDLVRLVLSIAEFG